MGYIVVYNRATGGYDYYVDRKSTVPIFTSGIVR